MKVTALKLRDSNFGDQWNTELEDHWEYADFLEKDDWRKNWISFDCLCYDVTTDTVFAGITSFDADIFWGWNRKEQKWVDAGYARIRNPYDAKFHRSLVRDSRNGCMYAAQALLHDIDRFWEAPGASFVKYNPSSGDIAKLAIPMPHVYIQSVVLDESRDMLYGQTFTPENLVSYNIKTGESRWIGPTGCGFAMAQGENITMDDNGCIWGAWQVTRAWQSQAGVDSHRLYKYDPEGGRISYLNKGLPNPNSTHGHMKPEGFFNLNTGCLYVSGGSGILYRVDPKTGDATLLFQPIGDEGRRRRSRLASMTLAPDGFAYGVVGRDGECEVMKFNPKDESYELLGALKDSDSGVPAWQIHDICAAPDGTLYAAENDNPGRSSYLWEISL